MLFLCNELSLQKDTTEAIFKTTEIPNILISIHTLSVNIIAAQTNQNWSAAVDSQTFKLFPEVGQYFQTTRTQKQSKWPPCLLKQIFSTAWVYEMTAYDANVGCCSGQTGLLATPLQRNCGQNWIKS